MPVLIHIGYPKAGSTLLQHWFNAHPDVFFKTDFLAPYSQTGNIPAYPVPDLRGKQHFVISEEQLVLWQGPLNMVGLKFKPFDIPAQQQKTANSLHQNFKQAKVLIVTRGFESLLRSMYLQYVSMGGVLHFKSYQSEMGPHLGKFYNYSYVIPLYRSLFGTENVIVLPFELLREDAPAFMNNLENQTGIHPNPAYALHKANPAIDTKLVSGYLRLSRLLCEVLNPLPKKYQVKIYTGYVQGLLIGKFNGAISLLSHLSKENNLTVSPASLSYFKNNAEILRHEKLFAPYLKEYLL